MRKNIGNSRSVVERFLSDLGEPILPEQAERAMADVRERLQTEDWRVPAPIAVFRQASPRNPVRVWAPVAAVVLLVLAAGLLQFALLPRAQSNVVANSVRGDLTVAGIEGGMFVTSPEIEAGRVIRAGAGGGTIALLDGSQVEIGPQAELSVVRVSEGLGIRLASGTVIVTAAKQREGHHLYVETKDCLISVIGTVFAVNAEETGSQISVIEGEVHVQRGEISQTLSAGQQASTSPQLGPLAQDIGNAWLATASTRLALLQQSTVPPPRPPAEPAPAAATAQNPPGNIIRGIVRNGASGEGLPDVTVTLCSPLGTRVAFTPNDPNAPAPPGGPAGRAYYLALWDSGKPCQGETVKTDSTGRFEFVNVKPADYMVTAQREGYVAPTGGWVNGWAGPDGKVAITRWNAANGEVNVWRSGVNGYTVSAGQGFAYARSLSGLPSDRTSVATDGRQPVSEVSLTLIGGNVISGHVRDADGRPVQNAVVRIVSRSPGASVDGPTVSTTLTNALGEYKAYGLTPGDYRIGASNPNGLPSAETWFSRSANPGEVSGVTVKQGENLFNIDIVLPRPQI